MMGFAEFDKLKLSNYCTNEILERVTSYEYLDEYWIGEVFGFSAVLNLESNPAIKCIVLDLSNNKDMLGVRVLTALQLGIRKGSSLEDVISVLGNPKTEQRFVKDRTTYEFHVDFDVAYSISCTIHNTKGLIFISIMND